MVCGNTRGGSPNALAFPENASFCLFLVLWIRGSCSHHARNGVDRIEGRTRRGEQASRSVVVSVSWRIHIGSMPDNWIFITRLRGNVNEEEN